MPERINWSVKIHVDGGPELSAAGATDVEAYDKLTVTIPAADETAAGSAVVQVQPGGAPQVEFLLVSASEYGDPLTYTVDSGDPIQLDAPQLLMGSGAVSLLGAAPNTFSFSNTSDQPVVVTILVGRNAITTS